MAHATIGDYVILSYKENQGGGGNICCFLRLGKYNYLLTNYHVVCDSRDKLMSGHYLVVKGSTGTQYEREIARVDVGEIGNVGGVGYVDWALCKVKQGVTMYTRGINGFSNPKADKRVFMYGQQGLGKGTIDEVDYRDAIAIGQYPANPPTGQGVLHIIGSKFSIPGDSGAAVLDATQNNICAQGFAGGGTADNYAVPIRRILDRIQSVTKLIPSLVTNGAVVSDY